MDIMFYVDNSYSVSPKAIILCSESISRILDFFNWTGGETRVGLVLPTNPGSRGHVAIDLGQFVTKDTFAEALKGSIYREFSTGKSGHFVTMRNAFDHVEKQREPVSQIMVMIMEGPFFANITAEIRHQIDITLREGKQIVFIAVDPQEATVELLTYAAGDQRKAFTMSSFENFIYKTGEIAQAICDRKFNHRMV